MIDQDLKRRMEEAYLAGDFDLALKLSQELDKQIVEAQEERYEKFGRKRKLALS